MKTKLALIIPSLRGGGAERVMVNITRYINIDKFDVILIVLKKEGPYLKDIPTYIKIIDLNCDRVRYSLVKIVKELNAYEPDVILSTLGHLNLALLSVRRFLKGNPKIFIREANTPSKDIIIKNRFKKKIITMLYKNLYPKANLIISQCQDMKADLIKTFNINPSKVKYIYNPIDLEKIQNDMKKFNPYNKDKINIVAAGRLCYQKDYVNLINAFKTVHNVFENTHLSILGVGELEDELRMLVSDYNLNEEVSFLGFKDNPYPYLHYADLYILSSRWEGFPNTLLEALACGTKVISTNCKSGPREILMDSKYGILVPVEDTKSLASAMINYLNEENRTSNRAQYFDVKRIIKEYQEVFSNKDKLN